MCNFHGDLNSQYQHLIKLFEMGGGGGGGGGKTSKMLLS